MVLPKQVGVNNQTLSESADDHRKAARSLQRYLTARSRAALLTASYTTQRDTTWLGAALRLSGGSGTCQAPSQCANIFSPLKLALLHPLAKSEWSDET